MNLMEQTYHILINVVYPRVKGELRISRIDLRGFQISRVVQNFFVSEIRRTGTERLDQRLKQTDNLIARVIFHQFDQSLRYSAIGNLGRGCQRSEVL